MPALQYPACAISPKSRNEFADKALHASGRAACEMNQHHRRLANDLPLQLTMNLCTVQGIQNGPERQQVSMDHPNAVRQLMSPNSRQTFLMSAVTPAKFCRI